MMKMLKHPYKFKKYGLNEKRQVHFIHLAFIFFYKGIVSTLVSKTNFSTYFLKKTPKQLS